MQRNYQLWTALPYAGETKPPSNPEEPMARHWPMYYCKRNCNETISDLYGRPIKLAIQNPNAIDWGKQLTIVQDTLKNITKPQIEIVKYWGTGVPTKQWTPVIDRLIDTYKVAACRASRILAVINAGVNDILVITWLLKFRWLVARPNQLDHNMTTILCTPRHPTYPAGHSTVAGLVETLLSYFFPGEATRLKQLAQEAALARLYSGVHFSVDNSEGIRLGNQIGKIIINTLSNQRSAESLLVDIPYQENHHAQLPPPPYTQMIDFKFEQHCQSKVKN